MLSFCATLTLFFPCCGNGVYSQQKLYTNLLQFLIEFLILLSYRRKFCTWNTVKNCRKCWKKKKLFRWFLFNKNIVVALVEHQQLSNDYYCYYVVFSSVAFYSKKKKNWKWLLFFNAFETLSLLLLRQTRVGETQNR